MHDDFEATFVVDLAPNETWEVLTSRSVAGDSGDEVHYVLPGFPSFAPLDIPGASCTTLEVDVGRLLRVKKDHEPCAGTEIVITLEQANTGTRVTVVQSGFGPFLDFAGRDTVFGHGDQIMRDFHLYLERGLTVPGTVWGPALGAKTQQTPTGLEIARVDPGSFAQNVGLRAGDLLLTLRGIRLHDTQQLFTVLALTEAGDKADVTWARGRESMHGNAKF